MSAAQIEGIAVSANETKAKWCYMHGMTSLTQFSEMIMTCNSVLFYWIMNRKYLEKNMNLIEYVSPDEHNCQEYTCIVYCMHE